MKFHFILPWAMLSFLVFVIQPLIKSQTHDKVNLVSSGIDVDEGVAIQVMRADYNLSLLYLIEGTEDYLGDRKDTNGNTFLDAVFHSLRLFTGFRRGRYITSVDSDWQWIDQAANVGAETGDSPSFPWRRQSEQVALDLSAK
jgi:hypothetical protein